MNNRIFSNNEMSKMFSSSEELRRSLDMVSREIANRADLNQDGDKTKSWKVASDIVEGFNPVPDLCWRLANFVFNGEINSRIKKLPEGFVLGLKNILLKAANDDTLGSDIIVTNTREALEVLSPDIVAACVVIHSICRKLEQKEYERIWKPMLDDAIVRARIGYMLGLYDPQFGCGRGMLAGFSGRSGLVVTISMGTLGQAKETLDALTYSKNIASVGLRIYGCEPLQVSSMLLSASGCGRDAAFGMAGFSVYGERSSSENSKERIGERKWQAAFAICEAIRKQKFDETSEETWSLLGLSNEKDRQVMLDKAKEILRNGHHWEWLIGW